MSARSLRRFGAERQSLVRTAADFFLVDASSASATTSRTGGERRGARSGQRGQALPLFVLLIFVLTGSVAVVVDVSWFWVNQQKMQRAADAGALAGAVYLPGDVTGAYSAARAATARNGFIDGVGGVAVSPQQSSQDKRQLAVTVQGPVGTYFARVFGMSQITAKASSKAVFTLPVPMGSPQNYYGVGTFLYDQLTTNYNNTPGDTGWDPEGAVVTGGAWTSPTSAATNNNIYATAATNNQAQQWNTFGLLTGASAIPNDPSTVIDGLEVQLADVFIGGSGTSTNCNVAVEVSWDGGTTWSTSQSTSALNTTNTTDKIVGAAASTTSWGAHAWVRSDFSDTNFRVRLTWTNGTVGCASTRTVSLDQLIVRTSFHYTTTSVTSTLQTGSVADPGGGTLSSQGFWGAIITRGGNRSNGDQYSPQNDDSSISGHTSTNPDYDSAGYDYTVVIAGGSGQVQIFDPTFCETGPNGSGGNLGAGDHWIGSTPNTVTTVFSLWNENDTPYDTSDDTQITTSGTTFANESQADYSGVMGTPGHTGLTDCSSNPYHNAWWTLASGLSAGTYRVNVNTNAASNTATSAENMWSLWVNSSGASPQVYGEARMVAYNNLLAGTQLFYLAKIDATNAGRTMDISLFDPGDVSGNAYLKIKSPDGSAYNYATFSYTADNGRSGTGVTQIQTANGSSLFNDALITIDIPLPNNYGSGGLTPSGETQAGWWKIEYTVAGGNDTTTWQVGIRGSPDHLVQ